jgi:hypothetical protein
MTGINSIWHIIFFAYAKNISFSRVESGIVPYNANVKKHATSKRNEKLDATKTLLNKDLPPLLVFIFAIKKLLINSENTKLINDEPMIRVSGIKIFLN